MKYWNKGTWNDRWAIETIFNKSRDGFFVEAGAQSGRWGSCTYALELELGWTGILVEPIDSSFKNLVKNRPNSKCVNACLDASNNEVVEFIEYKNKIGYSGLSKYWAEWKVKELDVTPHRKVKKQSITLEKLLDDHHAPRVIDYLALDIEASEEAVLKVFPFDKYTFRAISIETVWGGKTCKLLRKNGYKKVLNSFQDKKHEQYFIYE